MTSAGNDGPRLWDLTPGEAVRSVLAPDDLPVLGRIGDVDVIRVLRGGAGKVVIGVPRGGPRIPVALKTFADDVVLDAGYRRAFLRECAVAMKLARLPGYLPVFGVWELEGRPYLAMRAMIADDDGVVSLRDLIRGGKIPILYGAFIAWALADSLAAAARVIPRFVHGDIKPDNVLLSAGLPYISDFGLARATGAYETSDEMPTTAAYRAPEAGAPAAPLSVASDVYAFGVMLHEILAASSDDDAELRKALCVLAQRCTAPDPGERPENFVDLARGICEHVPTGWGECAGLLAARNRVAKVAPSLASWWTEEIGSLLRFRQPELILDLIQDVPPHERTIADWRYSALALVLQDRDIEALPNFERAAEISERADDAFELWKVTLDLVGSLTHLGMLDEAEAACLWLVDTAGDQANLALAVANLAVVRIERGQFETAEKTLQAASRLDTPAAKTSVIFARVHTKLGRTRQALESLRKAVILDPRPEYFILLGERLLALGAPGEALEAFETAIAMGILDPPLLHQALVASIAASAHAQCDALLDLIAKHHGEQVMALTFARSAHPRRRARATFGFASHCHRGVSVGRGAGARGRPGEPTGRCPAITASRATASSASPSAPTRRLPPSRGKWRVRHL
ncbi:MAG TPA: protein kinase family protein [Frankiaceae bacterium]|nr:protein kinase family protein [Frankiaceae bacterium]